MVSSTKHKLPVIDFSNIDDLKPGKDSWSKTRDEVVSALEEYGCFVASYDKISRQLHDEVFESLNQLFDLPTETKVKNKSIKPLFGYVGGIPLVPLYESLGIDDSNTIEGIQNFTKVMWPNGNELFSESMVSFSKAQVELEQMVIRMIFEKYGVEKYCESYLKLISYLTRVMRYRDPQEDESNMGFVSHTDKSFMAIVHQHEIDGLEIRSKDGEWFGVELGPSSYVVMAGDAIMAWSNNRIESPHHRVIMHGKGQRHSTAHFSFVDGIIETPAELIDDDHPAQYKPFDHLEFLRFYSKEENRKEKHERPLKIFCGV